VYHVRNSSPFTVHGFAVCGWQSNSFSSSSSRLRQAYGAASCPRTCCPAQRFGVRGFSRLERERRPVRRAIVRTTNEKLFAIWSRMGVSSGQLYALTHFSMNVVSEIDTARTRMSRPSSLRFGAPSIQHWARRRVWPRRRTSASSVESLCAVGSSSLPIELRIANSRPTQPLSRTACRAVGLAKPGGRETIGTANGQRPTANRQLETANRKP
jgi:hypothetical protein